MDEITYRQYLTRAREMEAVPGQNRQIEKFWSGYQDGLKRHYLGARFESEWAHNRRMAIPDDHQDTAHRYRGIGYRAGFAGADPEGITVEVRKRGRQKGIAQKDKPKTERVMIRLTAETKEAWEDVAKGMGVPTTTAMGECLEREVAPRRNRLGKAVIRMIRKGRELAYQNNDDLLGRMMAKVEELVERII